MKSLLRALLGTLTLASLVLAVVSSAATAGGKPGPCPDCADTYPPSSQSAPNGGQVVSPLVDLGSLSVANGVATVTGNVANGSSPSSAAAARSHVGVTVNGRSVNIGAAGQFTGTAPVRTGSRAAITVQANDASSGESVTMTIPVSAVPANGDPVNATATLEASGTTIVMPADGFTSYDGTSTDVTVGVNSTKGLGRLAINGTNVLASLRVSSGTSGPSAPPRSGQPPAAPSGSQPSSGGQPAQQVTRSVSGSAKSVDVTVSDKRGVTQTTRLTIRRISSVIRIARSTSVSALGARGLRIARLTLDARSAATTRNVRVNVTLRDRRNYLVRGAIVMVAKTPGCTSISGQYAQISNRLGAASFRIPVSKASLGKRLYVTVVARTPRALAQRTGSVRVPARGPAV